MQQDAAKKEIKTMQHFNMSVSMNFKVLAVKVFYLMWLNSTLQSL